MPLVYVDRLGMAQVCNLSGGYEAPAGQTSIYSSWAVKFSFTRDRLLWRSDIRQRCLRSGVRN